MEQKIQKKVIEFSKRNQERMAEETGIQPSLTDEDVKAYLDATIRNAYETNGLQKKLGIDTSI